MADASVVAPLFPLPFAGKNVRTTSEKKATKKGGGSGWLGWLGGEDCPDASRIQINSVRNFSSSAEGTCFASFGWQFACTRQPSTANSCWFQFFTLPQPRPLA